MWQLTAIASMVAALSVKQSVLAGVNGLPAPSNSPSQHCFPCLKAKGLSQLHFPTPSEQGSVKCILYTLLKLLHMPPTVGQVTGSSASMVPAMSRKQSGLAVVMALPVAS